MTLCINLIDTVSLKKLWEIELSPGLVKSHLTNITLMPDNFNKGNFNTESESRLYLSWEKVPCGFPLIVIVDCLYHQASI